MSVPKKKSIINKIYYSKFQRERETERERDRERERERLVGVIMLIVCRSGYYLDAGVHCIRKECQGYGARSSDRNCVIDRPRRGFHIDTPPDPCKFRYVREVRLDRACTPTFVMFLQSPRLRSLRAVRVERHCTPRFVMDVHSPKSRLVSVFRLDRDCTPRSDMEVHSRTLIRKGCQ